jgi:hypothetical protein
MPKELIQDLEPCRTERGHDCARPILRLPVRTVNNGLTEYLRLRFLLDTGASTTAIPVARARNYHIPFEMDEPLARCFSLASPLDGYWGVINVILLDERIMLPCFFYQPRQELVEPHQKSGLIGPFTQYEVKRSTPPATLADWELQSSGKPVPVQPTLLLGRAGFLDRFSIAIRSGKLRIAKQ